MAEGDGARSTRNDARDLRIRGWCAPCRSRCGCIPAVRDGRLAGNAAVGTEHADPVSGSFPLRSYPCEVRRSGGAEPIPGPGPALR